MNLFLVIIPFLVSMAVFAHTAIIQVSLPPATGAGSAGPKKEELKLTLLVSAAQYTLAVGDSIFFELQSNGTATDYRTLRTALVNIRPTLLRPDDIVVAVNDGIVFDRVVNSMDQAREAGFVRIGLSAGAVQERSKP